MKTLDRPDEAAQQSIPTLDAGQAPAKALIEEARRRHRRRRYVVLTLVMLLACVAAVVGLIVGGGGGPRSVAVRPHSARPPANPRFAPPAITRGGRTTMDIRLPDGRGFALSYPHSLDLSSYHLTLVGGEVNWPVVSGRFTCCDEGAIPYFGTIGSIFVGKPLAVYPGAHGQAVPYYSGAQAAWPFTEPTYDYFAFTFGHWVVLVMDIGHTSYYTARMTNAQRATWARSFDAHLTSGGYLVLAPHSPLHLYRGALDIILHGANGNLLEIAGPQSCPTTQANPEIYSQQRAWCAAGVHLDVSGQTAFVDQASAGLDIQSLPAVR